MASGDGHTGEVEGPEADNVIRFPRDWIGSKDDLVPFGPSADRIRAERAARAAETRTLGTPVPEATEHARDHRDRDGDLSAALNASDFWGEGAGPLHEAVELVGPEESGIEDEPVALSPDRRIQSRSAGHRPRREAASACIVGVMILLAGAGFLLVHSGSPSRSSHAAALRVSAGPGVAFPDPEHLVVLVAAAQARSAGSRAADRHDSAGTSHAAHTARTHAVLSHKRSVARSQPAGGHAAVETNPAPISASTQTGSPASSGGSSDSVSPPAAGESVDTSGGTASSSTGNDSGGPTGFGTVAGKLCNPHC